jgi:hypothetical protein
MNNAMEQNLFFLNFPDKPFAIQQGIPRSLQNLHLFLELRVWAEKSEDSLATGEQSPCLHGYFAAGKRFFDPGFRLAPGWAGRIPEIFRLHKEVLEER